MSYVAISKVSYPANLKQKIQAVGLEMLPIAQAQPGYISVAFHVSLERHETMMYWEWQSRSDHEACMGSDAWSAIMQKHGSLFAQDGVEFVLETYERLEQ